MYQMEKGTNVNPRAAVLLLLLMVIMIMVVVMVVLGFYPGAPSSHC